MPLEKKANGRLEEQQEPQGVGPESDESVVVHDVLETQSKEPKRYAVIVHNDDYTTMEFVIEVLSKFFRHTNEQAVQLMLKIHSEGSAVAGVYSLDIAETKVSQVMQFARSRSFPLKLSTEPMDEDGGKE